MSCAEIVLDTNAIKEIILKDENKWVFDYIKQKCHNLIIPPLDSEYRGRLRIDLRAFPSLLTKFRAELGSKFIPNETPEFPRNIDHTFRGRGRRNQDKIVAGVAIKRARITSRTAIIVSDDPDFHDYEVINYLRRYGVKVYYISEFFDWLKEDC
jgi:hypothetical protein